MEDFGEFSRLSSIRGYHVYKDSWEATVGESLVCEREPSNAEDRYAVSVKKGESIVGHLPRNISRICSLFLRRGGTIECTVTGGRRYSHDLVQGGLEIPCLLIFKSKPTEVNKLKKLWKK